MTPFAEPLVSIIMPCYNAANTIHAAMASVQTQSFPDWELVVVDDGSSDGSSDVARSFQDTRIAIVSQENRGLPAARNRGLQEARGRFVAFLDSDDTWHPEFLEKTIHALIQREDAVLAYCGWQNLGLAGRRSEPFIPPDYNKKDRVEVLLAGCRWPVHAALVCLATVKNAGGFDETLGACEDYDFWLRVALFGRLVLVPEVLAYYHHHDGQMTKNRLRIALSHWQVQQKFIEQHPHEAQRLGRKRVRELVEGELLKRAYVCYWQRDLPTARALFRKVMRAGYGSPRDWMHMLPALLPLALHQGLLQWLDSNRRKAPQRPPNRP